eukprot:7361186-Alexandrium_andersonii.AAC.1
MWRHVPRRWRPRAPFDEKQLPAPYLTQKGKCLDRVRGGLSCQKPHAHEREIAAAPAHPRRRFMRSTA